ncbi:MAG: radical SAM protein [Firmicutes bacterium]|nr:radical SAM protein [Bacillota bacterium]
MTSIQHDQGVRVYNQGLMDLLSTAARICISDPAQAGFIARTAGSQRRAARTRERWEEQGTHVPPFVIISVTSECNLHCKGCYARAQHRDLASGAPGVPAESDERGNAGVGTDITGVAAAAAVAVGAGGRDIDDATLRAVLDDAGELGISVALLAGGEPLTRPGLLDIVSEYPDILFPIFTNGLLIDDNVAARLRRQKNTIPVLSLEGNQEITDDRRGSGVWSRVRGAAQALRRARVFFGSSFTVRSDTLDALTDERFIREMIGVGCRLFFFVEYVPVQPGTESWELTQDQRLELARRVEALRSSTSALFVSFPGDEDATGGCLAAGRGFVHISARGDVEPCPFAPYSDSSVCGASLRDALKSPLLEAIRADQERFGDTSGGCALWRRREQVQALLESHDRERIREQQGANQA